MIYPASYDITILQNSSWQASLRATDNRQSLSSVIVSSGLATFIKPCHKLLAGDKVVLTADTGAAVPCGLNLNEVYFVRASGLTGDSFKLSTTISGAEISVSGTASGQYYAANPVNLTGYIIDADIFSVLDGLQAATFVCTTPDPENGLISVSMGPSVSSGIAPGSYHYDLSFTSSGGERYYWLSGLVTVQRTYSRN
jgi:hypothetical protein